MVDGIHSRKRVDALGGDRVEDALELDAADALGRLVQHVIELAVRAVRRVVAISFRFG